MSDTEGNVKYILVQVERLNFLLTTAFEDFIGAVFSGGTTAGISGIVGDLPPSKKGAFRKVPYLPQYIPAWAECYTGYEIYFTRGSGFFSSPLKYKASLIGYLRHKGD